MYFWVDDWGVAYKMVFPSEAPNPSSLGSGIFGQGPYRYLETPFILLYRFFNLNAGLYFALGLIQYFLASIILFLFIKDVSKNTFLAASSAAIFASGYIGSYAIYRLSNSYQLVDTAIFTILIIWSLVSFFKIRKPYFYWISILLFTFLLEFLFLRGHGVLFVVLTVFLLFIPSVKKVKDLIRHFLSSIPFFIIYAFYYLFDPRLGPKTAGSGFSNLFPDFFQKIIIERDLSLFQNIFITFSNLFIPLPLVKNLVIIFKYQKFESLILFFSILLLSLIFFVYRKIKNREMSVFLLPLGVGIAFSNILIYFLYMPTSYLDSNSRYLIPAFVGSSIVLGYLVHLIKGRVKFLVLGVTIATFIYLERGEQNYIVTRVSQPDKMGYELIKSQAKSMNPDTIFFVEPTDDPEVKSNILGNIPQLGIPTVLGYSGNARMAYTYTDLYKLLAENNGNINNFQSYFFNGKTYVSTTSEIRDLLKRSRRSTADFSVSSDHSGIESALNFPSLVPSFLTIEITALPSKVKSANTGEETILYWMTDRRDNFIADYSTNFELINDGKPHIYSFLLPAQGTILRKVKIVDPSKAFKISVGRSYITTLNLEEIKKL